MKCKDCKNFKTQNRNRKSNLEASKDLSFFDRIKGFCSVDERECEAEDNCGCGAYSQKK